LPGPGVETDAVVASPKAQFFPVRAPKSDIESRSFGMTHRVCDRFLRDAKTSYLNFRVEFFRDMLCGKTHRDGGSASLFVEE
jgi:hypothetical protein